MLFCERITDAEALSVLNGGLDMNLPFWRDVRNKNPTTFDQLVEMITEEITNENMILHRNRGGVAPNQVPRINYGKSQVRHLPQPPPSSERLPSRPELGYKLCGLCTRRPAPSISNPNGSRRPANQDPPRRSSRSPVRLPRAEGTTEYRFIKGPEKPPIREIDTIYGGPYIEGQSRNAQKSYAKEAEGKLMTNWLINSRPSGSSKVDAISFTEKDMRGVHYPHYDALVVRAVVARNGLGRMLVDNESSVNVIFLSTYEQMNIDVPLEPSTEPLYGFTGDCVTPKGIIRLAVTMGEEPLAAHTFMKFLVVDRRSAYHGVLCRPALKELWAVTSIHHLCMKFSTEGRIATVRGNQPEARKCYRNALRKAEKKEMNMTIRDVEMEEALKAALEDVKMEEASFAEDIDPRITGADSQTSSIEELESFLADPDDPTKKLQVGKDLLREPKEVLKRCFRDNLDVFTWRHEDMVGIHPKISCHHLNIDPKFPSHR
ncbi:Uncharacterized protein Adt_40264 [Abeliophyllum distichum]|uniref:Uncharacterized protein n=1 Tax=Abeliophyllum distichum TaxID=126358 RepID=A0ABD1Q7G3_9LAMI